MKKWVRELTKEGVQLDREKMKEEPKGPRAFLPKRWIMERTFSWLGQNRRMSKDYEKLPQERRSLHLRGDEPLDGEEIGSLMRLFRQFHETV